jgi:hypothetical protein
LEASLSNWPNFILAPHLDAFLTKRAEQHQQVAAERFGMEAAQGQAPDDEDEEGGAYGEDEDEVSGAMEDEEGGPIAPNDVEGGENGYDEQDEQ